MWFKPVIFQLLLATARSFVNTQTHTPIELPQSMPSFSPLLHASEGLATTPPSTMQLVLELETFNNELKRTLGKQIVLQISSLLPKVDTIGHDILHANNVFVTDVLANDHMSDDFKKDIILLSIKMAQYGDDLGSFFLQQYYNIVDFSI
jgi:hypothetical protein